MINCRSDTKHLALCGRWSLIHCRTYCQDWKKCFHLSLRSKARRRLKEYRKYLDDFGRKREGKK